MRWSRFWDACVRYRMTHECTYSRIHATHATVFFLSCPSSVMTPWSLVIRDVHIRNALIREEQDPQTNSATTGWLTRQKGTLGVWDVRDH